MCPPLDPFNPRLEAALRSSVTGLEGLQNEISKAWTNGVVHGYSRALLGMDVLWGWRVLRDEEAIRVLLEKARDKSIPQW